MSSAVIEDYKEPVKANAFAPVAQALLDAGEGKSVRITTTVAELARTQRAFGHAANALEPAQTARRRDIKYGDNSVTHEDVQGLEDDAEVQLVFTLGPKQQRSGRPRKDAEPVEESAPAKGKK